MKKINLKGISEFLNEKELKNVMGGKEEKPPVEPQRVIEAACKNLLPGSDCALTSSGATVWGTCLFEKNREGNLTGKILCYI